MITCSSNNGGRNFCAADTRGGVRMVNQRSGSPCIQGRTWGFDRPRHLGRSWLPRRLRSRSINSLGGNTLALQDDAALGCF